MRRIRYLICAATFLVACAPPAPPAAPSRPEAPEAPPQARESIAETYGHCPWGEVKGASLSIWSYACPDDRLVADETVPGFVRETRDPSGKLLRAAVIRVFAKPADAPIEAILPAVRAASPGAEACAIEPGSHGDYVLMPTGAAAEAYTKHIEGKGGDDQLSPCGALGPSEGGQVTFRLIEGAPDKVVMISWPSDVPIFDPDTLRAISPAKD